MITPATPTQPIPLARDERAAVRAMGTAELGAFIDTLRDDLADVSSDPAVAAVERMLAMTWLALARAEWARRQRLHAAGADVSDPDSTPYAAWRDLAREVRERADIVAVFEAAGFGFARKGRAEYAGPCPLCLGTDRFRLFVGPPSRYWCRQCGLSGDVISAARNFLHVTPAGVAARTGAQAEPISFFAAVRYLAAEVGLPTPDDGIGAETHHPQGTSSGPRLLSNAAEPIAIAAGDSEWAPLPVRGGGRRGR